MLKGIAVPVDGRQVTEHALPLVEALARQTGATIHLLFVADASMPSPPLESFTPFRYEGIGSTDWSWQRRLRERDAEYLVGLAERVGEESETRVSTTLLLAPTAPEVHRLADAVEAELIVVAMTAPTEPRGWLDNAGFSMLQRARLPLLLAPPPGDRDVRRRFERVLVPLDGSAFSEQIIEHVLSLDPTRTAELVLLQVLPVPERASLSSSGLPLDNRDLLSRQGLARDYLRRVAAELKQRGVDASTRTMVHASAPDAILQAATDHDVDLVAMATHGRGGLTRLLLGSVAEEVLRATSRPLLLFRPREGMKVF